jgi:hypothetical protein
MRVLDPFENLESQEDPAVDDMIHNYAKLAKKSAELDYLR